MQEVKKVVIIGPESTGKSTLCKQLAGHYNTLWCPEYAREYLLKHGTAYSYENLLEVAIGQLKLEDEYIERVRELREHRSKNSKPKTTNHKLQTTNSAPLFIDTNMYVMKVWCEVVFQKCHQYILDKIVEREYDFYILCNTDLPWIKDELREYPDFETRQKLFHIYKDILINQHVPWAEVAGHYDQRFKQAVESVDKIIFSS